MARRIKHADVAERTRCWLRAPGGRRLGWAPAAVDVARCVPVGAAAP